MAEKDKQDQAYSWKAFLPFTKEGRAMRKKKEKQKKDRKEKKDFKFTPHLKKAGFKNTGETQIKKILFTVSVGISLLLSIFLLISAAKGNKSPGEVLLFMAGYWTAFFLLVLAVVSFFFMIYLDLRAYQRTKDVDEVLPDFLQLASSNMNAGMPLDRALWMAVRPNFGILAEEIEYVAKSTYAGKDLRTSLREFAERFDSGDLDRAVSLIIEGMDAGGEVADLLNKISLNIEETSILKKEMAANVTTYVVFIGMATLLGAPFLFGLATQLLVMIKSIVANVGGLEMSSSGFFSLSLSADAVSTSDFKTYSVMMLMVTSFFSGAIMSVIRKGNVKDGATLIPGLMVSTFLLYQLSNWLLSGLLSLFML